MSTEQLPVLDLSDATSDDPARQQHFRQGLREATHHWGFFYLVGHGIPDDLGPRLVALSREFFDLPLEAKLEIDKLNSPHYRGYSRVGHELTKGAADVREQIDVANETTPVPQPADDAPWDVLRGPNQWPTTVPELRPTVEQWLGHGERISRVLLREWLAALHQPANLVEEAFEVADQRLKLVRYPEVEPGEHNQGVGSHKDAGFLTLLHVEQGKGGLEVDKDGAWIAAQNLPGALVVNIGEMLEVATDGYLKATRHRVVSPTTGQGDRISVPYFFGPDLSARLEPWPLPDELAADAPGTEVEAHNRILADYGLNVLKSWTRSHPAVTGRHHAELARRLDLPR